MISKAVHGKSVFSALILAGILLSLFLGGCGKYRRRNILFNIPENLETKNVPLIHLNRDSTDTLFGWRHRIRPGDRISIRILNNFDLEKGITITGQDGQADAITYQVNQDSIIVLPMVGRVKIGGLTRNETALKLQGLFKTNLVEPTIDVNLVGLSFSVLGEVRRPGVFPMDRASVSIAEALARAGGITQFGKRNKVKIFRGARFTDNPEVIVLDLSLLSALELGQIIIRDQDIVHVEPRDIKVVADALSPYSTLISLLASVSAIVVVAVNVSNNFNR